MNSDEIASLETSLSFKPTLPCREALPDGQQAARALVHHHGQAAREANAEVLRARPAPQPDQNKKKTNKIYIYIYILIYIYTIKIELIYI